MQPTIASYTWNDRFVGLIFYVDDDKPSLLLHHACAKENKKNEVTRPETWMPLTAKAAVASDPFGEIARCAGKKYNFSRRTLAAQPNILSAMTRNDDQRLHWLAIEATRKFEWTDEEKRKARAAKSQQYWKDIRWFDAENIADSLNPMSSGWKQGLGRALRAASLNQSLFDDLYRAFQKAL